MEQIKSKKFSFNFYDFYSLARDLFLFVLAYCVANISLVETFLTDHKVDTLVSSIIIWSIIEMGRRFLNGSKK